MPKRVKPNLSPAAFPVHSLEDVDAALAQIAARKRQIDLIGLANQVERMVEDIPLNDIKVAVMGCVVNGPGEAKEADIGIAGGKGTGMLIKKGEIVQRMPESELLGALREELLHWNEN